MKIPPEAQRQLGAQFRKALDIIQTRYNTTEEENLLLLLSLIYGYARAGNLTCEQLSTLAVNVWQVHSTQEKETKT